VPPVLRRGSFNEDFGNLNENYAQGDHSPGKPGKVRELKSGQGKVRENVFLHARNLATWFSG